MADNIKYRFIQNVGDFFPSGYFGEDFIDRVQKVSGYNNDQVTEVCSKYVQFRRKYDEYKNRMVTQALRPKDSIRYTHEFHTELLKLLGYGELGKPYGEPYILDEERMELIPVRHVLHRNDIVQMLVMEMRSLVKVGDEEPAGLFEQQYAEEGEANKPSRFTASHWSDVFTLPEGYKISPAVVNKAISRIFLLPEDHRPSYILMCAGNTVFLFDKEKWNRGSYLSFSLDDLFSQASSSSAFRKYYALFHWLLCKETLSPQGETILMDALVEDSYKNAYEVTKDLKEGVVSAVETLANEALWFWEQLPEDSEVYNPLKTIDYTDDTFEAEVKDDCLVYIYRLLFLFYAESRTELDILPTGDDVYDQGYSLEMLRDLEQVRLISEESKRGYFFDTSLKRLFSLLSTGHKENQPKDQPDHSFSVRHIDSPMFDDSKLHHLGQVRFRNEKWQQIICALSLSKKQQRRGRGRISYANLGVNQLGSVYESLLAYRGFYAEESYIEVHKAGCPEDGTFLVPYSRMDDFNADEILRKEDGTPVVLEKGTFVYRLNGRDRQKSASYYTPEILTRSTVKYTLKAIIDEVKNGKRKALDLLDLKILEPAMGAAAFQNEVINQLADAYLTYRQEEKKKEYIERGSLDEDHLEDGSWRIAPDHYRDELQKVKAFIATHNVYGVDLNPTAIELGKLSLWLNVIHKDMETPFFSNRLALGNAVIGAWLKVYNKEDVIAVQDKSFSKTVKWIPTLWWEKAPHKIRFYNNKKRINRSVNKVYHFLLPDKAMLAVRNITEQKKAYPEETTRMNALIKDWTAPITEVDFRIMQRLSKKIDLLLKEYYEFQRDIESKTENKMVLWGVPGNYQTETFLSEKYAEKEKMFDTRMRHDNAYFRLKMVMDYWCALWFWEYDKSKLLPNRRDYWSDIEAMLDVTDQEISANTTHALSEAMGKKALVTQGVLAFEGYATDIAREDIPIVVPDEENSEPIHRTKEQILAKNKEKERSFYDNSERFQLVNDYAERYHFFHPMLEFLEVFWLRDGFDIICGNPPWVLPAFDVLGVFAEKFPEVILHGMKAPDVRMDKESYFKKAPFLEKIYFSELTESTCSNVLTNCACLYPYLQGIKTDLYMCILESSYDMLSDKGYIGMVHPESIYDTAKLGDFRNEAYHRLRYHFQYHNELKLFAEVHHETTYSVNIYGRHKDTIGFLSIHNLFHPNTVDSCFVHDGSGFCYGVKHNGKWNIEPHKDRIVYFDESALKVLADAFEDDETSATPKLINTQSESTISVVEKLAKAKTHVRDYNTIITVGFNETTAVDDGFIERSISQPLPTDDIILNGPHIYVSTPYYKMPRPSVENNSSYDVIDYTRIGGDFVPATCFKSLLSHDDFRNFIKGFIIGQDQEGKNIYDCWLDHYKLGISEWVGSTSERTLSGAIIPPGSHHIGTIVSTTFRNNEDMVELCGLINSIPLDFYMKITGASHVKQYRIEAFPLGIENKYKTALFVRVLMLNCITDSYSSLWKEMWKDEYTCEKWSIRDPRLKSFTNLKSEWDVNTPLRTYYERHVALVEIDVIVAMALGLSLNDLEMIYSIQFPVFQQNEDDTWYDSNGNIIYTKSSGLKGVGLIRKSTKTEIGWEDVRGKQINDNTFAGIKPSHEHIINSEKSSIYGGEKIEFVAPYSRVNRIEEYRIAWSHFEKVFDNK